MLTVGIAMDEWKLPIFSKVLNARGYNYSQHPGLTRGAVLLKVKVCEKDIDNFKVLVESAESKAANWRK